MDIVERPLSTSEIQDLSRPLENDLISVFGVIGDACDRLLDTAVSEGWTPDQYIDELVRLIDGDNRASETVEPIGRNKETVIREIMKSFNSLAARFA